MTNLRGASSGVLFYQLERLFGQGTAIGLTEGELLERFVSRRDEAAFEALVARHGPMVLGVCRHLLRDPNDVDDAFQATFLVLVKKASTVRRCELLGNWLYGVAFRVASRARAMAARRTARVVSGHDAVENLTAAMCHEDGGLDPTTLFDQSPWLHQEVSHLPDKYRTPIILCYFEGLTHDEAALRLGWPLGTVKGRLARARELLRRRLTRRGVTLSTAALASQLAISDGHAAVPAALQLATLTAAQALAGHVGLSLAATSVISIPVSALVEGALQAMFASQVKTLAIPLLLVAGTVATGVAVSATQLAGGAQRRDQAAPAPAISPAKSKAQGRPPGPQPAARMSNDPIAAATVSPELLQELNQAATLFDRLLSALRDPNVEDISRLDQWSLLTLQAQQRLSTARADDLAAAEAHRDRVKKLHLRIANLVGTDETTGLLKFTSMKLNEANQLLAAQQDEMKGAGPRPDMLADGLKPAPPESPKPDVPSPAGGAHESASAPKNNPGFQPAGGMMGGKPAMPAMMGGGVDARSDAETVSRQMRPQIAALAADLASRESDPKSKVVLKKLDEPISMSFAHETPLEDILKYIKQAATTATYAGIPIYVDPKGLKEATATLQSPVSLDLEGVPLKTTLRLILKQIGLAYCVRDGVLIISSVQGINEELREACIELGLTVPDQMGGIGGGGMQGMGGMR
jgi:RNA polymerase sigma factor (sigma-70 family)